MQYTVELPSRNERHVVDVTMVLSPGLYARQQVADACARLLAQLSWLKAAARTERDYWRVLAIRSYRDECRAHGETFKETSAQRVAEGDDKVRAAQYTHELLDNLWSALVYYWAPRCRSYEELELRVAAR